MVKVYAFEMFDVATGEMSPSKCLATEKFITTHEGTALEGTGLEVQPSQLDADGRYYPSRDSVDPKAGDDIG